MIVIVCLYARFFLLLVRQVRGIEKAYIFSFSNNDYTCLDPAADGVALRFDADLVYYYYYYFIAFFLTSDDGTPTIFNKKSSGLPLMKFETEASGRGGVGGGDADVKRDWT